jgi:hypothetical protein
MQCVAIMMTALLAVALVAVLMSARYLAHMGHNKFICTENDVLEGATIYLSQNHTLSPGEDGLLFKSNGQVIMQLPYSGGVIVGSAPAPEFNGDGVYLAGDPANFAVNNWDVLSAYGFADNSTIAYARHSDIPSLTATLLIAGGETSLALGKDGKVYMGTITADFRAANSMASVLADGPFVINQVRTAVDYSCLSVGSNAPRSVLVSSSTPSCFSRAAVVPLCNFTFDENTYQLVTDACHGGTLPPFLGPQNAVAYRLSAPCPSTETDPPVVMSLYVDSVPTSSNARPDVLFPFDDTTACNREETVYYRAVCDSSY